MAENRNQRKFEKRKDKRFHILHKRKTAHSWAILRNLFVCKHLRTPEADDNRKKFTKLGCSGSSLCIDNTMTMKNPQITVPSNVSSRSLKTHLNDANGNTSSSLPFLSDYTKRMQFRRLSGCYECSTVIDPVNGAVRDSSLRVVTCSCPHCGGIFAKQEDLEYHQTINHAVFELDPEDTSRKVVEIIFHSSWLKKQSSLCKIERILKVNNIQKTINRFEEYRDTIRTKANKFPKKHPRCLADGNELLRFHCTTFVCSIGMNGCSNLCDQIPPCNVCNIIRNGFKFNGSRGICTTATSGKAHDNAQLSPEEKHAMLVCRVIAGRVKRNRKNDAEEFDSVAGSIGVHSNIDELYVFNSKAILPCFVVIYSDS